MIEAAARSAVGQMYRCSPVCRRIRIGETGPIHEFDVYAEGIVIGGVSTGTPKTFGGLLGVNLSNATLGHYQILC